MTTADMFSWLKDNIWAVLLSLVPNLILLNAVLFMGLDPALVVLTYWAESAVVGLYALAGILLAKERTTARIGAAIFFIIHFGIFMGGHLLFLLAILGVEWATLPWNILWIPALCVASMFVSHGIEYFHDFRTLKINAWMIRPYSRVIVMHLIIIFGFFVLRWIGLAMVLGTLLVAIKMAFDIGMMARRKNAQKRRMRAATGS